MHWYAHEPIFIFINPDCSLNSQLIYTTVCSISPNWRCQKLSSYYNSPNAVPTAFLSQLLAPLFFHSLLRSKNLETSLTPVTHTHQIWQKLILPSKYIQNQTISLLLYCFHLVKAIITHMDYYYSLLSSLLTSTLFNTVAMVILLKCISEHTTSSIRPFRIPSLISLRITLQQLLISFSVKTNVLSVINNILHCLSTPPATYLSSSLDALFFNHFSLLVVP
jgi:hypothetical protein